jgi:hypothetical protein
MGIGIIISSLITPKIVPKLDANVLKIGALVIIMGFGLLIIITHQRGNMGLHWSQLLPYLFIIGIGQGLVIVPLLNIVLSHVRPKTYWSGLGNSSYHDSSWNLNRYYFLWL